MVEHKLNAAQEQHTSGWRKEAALRHNNYSSASDMVIMSALFRSRWCLGGLDCGRRRLSSPETTTTKRDGTKLRQLRDRQDKIKACCESASTLATWKVEAEAEIENIVGVEAAPSLPVGKSGRTWADSRHFNQTGANQTRRAKKGY